MRLRLGLLRMGLGRGLLLEGFRRLKGHGMDYAEVSTWGENTGMIHTAESVGYQVYSTTIFFLGAEFTKVYARTVGSQCRQRR